MPDAAKAPYPKPRYQCGTSSTPVVAPTHAPNTGAATSAHQRPTRNPTASPAHDDDRPDHAIDVDVRGALLERLGQQIGPELDGEPAGRGERLEHEDRVSDRDILEVVVARLERREDRPDGRLVGCCVAQGDSGE